ncbi:MAG: alkaline phosphatase, partial [Rhodopirellula bahusiensis]
MSQPSITDRVSTAAWNRRRFLAFSGALPAYVMSAQHAWADSKVSFSSDPFSLGVASGEPDHRGMVLWTRLAPSPLLPDGGMPA